MPVDRITLLDLERFGGCIPPAVGIVGRPVSRRGFCSGCRAKVIATRPAVISFDLHVDRADVRQQRLVADSPSWLAGHGLRPSALMLVVTAGAQRRSSQAVRCGGRLR